MGGSGGSFFGGSTPPKDLLKKIRKTEEDTLNEQFETDVSRILADLLAKYNNRNVEAINTHLNNIKKALNKEIDGTVDLLFGGSVSKHTYVDGLSDIDALVILNNSELTNMAPIEVKNYFFNRLSERFPGTDIRVGNLAVTLSFSDTEVQLLPAVKYENGFRIPNESGTAWSFIKPKEFADTLTKANGDQQVKVVPTVKLAKSIISNLPEKRQLTGYHTEAIAVEIFRDYHGAKNTKSMLKYFFAEAPKHILKPINDVTGQSLHVDEYLGAENSIERRVVADSMARIGRRMQNADGANSITQWKDILGL